MSETITPTVSDHAGPGALSGIRVLDLSRFIAGPYCAMLLGDLGADVVKVEAVGKGESSRGFEPKYRGESLYTAVFNRNKRSLTLDFRSSDGQALLRRLIAKADVVVENFVPGTLEKMGCGWEALRAGHPRLIMTRISGFGSSGPYSTRPCFDVIAQATTGLMDLTGAPEGPPTTAGTFVVDYSTALYATIGTLAAVQHRERTGEGQLVEATLLSSAMSMLVTAIPDQLLFGRTATRSGNRDRFNAPVNTFRTSEGDWIMLVVVGDQKFRGLAECMDRPELADDPKFSTNAARMENVVPIEAIVQEWTGRHTADELLSALESKGIPCAKVATVADLVEHPQVRERRMILDLPQGAGRIPVAGFAIDLERSPMTLTRGCPSMGEHTNAVLSDWLNLADADIAALKRRNTV